MHIATTLAASAALALTPPIANPLLGLSVSCGGLTLELDADGVSARHGNTTDFEITLELTSGTPVRISL